MARLTVVRIRFMVGGAAILTLFGGWWCFTALVVWAKRPPMAIPAAIAMELLLLALCIFRLVGSKKIPRSDNPKAAAEGKRAGVLFGIIFGIEGGLIALCSILLARHNLSDWIPMTIAVIVGVHFLPLARVFNVALYYWTGAFSVLGMLGCLLIREPSIRRLLVGLVMTAILWLTAALLLLRTRPATPAPIH